MVVLGFPILSESLLAFLGSLPTAYMRRFQMNKFRNYPLAVAGFVIPCVVSIALTIGTLLLAPVWVEGQSQSGAQASAGLNTKNRREMRQEQFLLNHMDSTGQVRPDLWRQGVEQLMRMGVAPSVPLAPGGLGGGPWTQIGPAPLLIDPTDPDVTLLFQGQGPDSGEVVDIAIDPRGMTDQVVYIATNDGGIWKSTDGRASWAPKTDFMPSLSMGAVALDPGNPSIVYAGTGNVFDAGETWSVLNPGGIFTTRGINRIVFPAPNVLLVAANFRMGPPETPVFGGGLFLSVDGGLNFGSNAPTFNNGQPVLAGFISDLDLDTASSATVYASVLGMGGIFRSTNGGVTFPTNLFANPGAPTAPFGFIAFTQSTQPDNQTLYASVGVAGASVSTFSETFLGLFKSTNGGATWTQPLAAGATCTEGPSNQCGYDQTAGVDPQNANRIYLGFERLYVSTDGGDRFASVSDKKIHWDQHALVFTPGTHISGGPPTRLYVGTDGGIATSGDGGDSWVNINEEIATNLFNSIDIGRGNAFNNGFTYGGTQDTGTIEQRPDFPGTDWHLGIDGDGGGVAVDPFSPFVAYGADDGFFIRTTDGGNTWVLACRDPSRPCFDPTKPPSAWRYAIDPNSSCGSVSCNVFVVTATPGGFSPGPQLFRSTDGGMSFSLINTFPESVNSIANVKTDSNIVWVGLTNGTVQRTASALAATTLWSPITVTGALNQPVSSIAIDPAHPEQVVVVYSRFCGRPPSGACAPGNRTRHVFRTTDNGATWTDISGTDGGGANLPDLPLHSVVIDASVASYTIIVASDAS